MSDNYGFLAPFYQMLSQAVFGKKILEANQAFLDDILDQELIFIGGGDGTAYQEYGNQLKGFYFEKSAKMLQLARKNLHHSHLHFVHGEYTGHNKGDCFFLPFLLDSLQDEEIEQLLEKIKSSISESGKVVVSDFFSPQTFRQNLLLQVMLLFFRIFTNHPRKDLPDYSRLFQKTGYRLLEEKVWHKGWIRAQVYVLEPED
ncbi:methyltransferase [Algoriphagus mannitolivorans]|uniref:methyltransferase n=1 Tax=Algoriphagus mannitolivorans TaxID=226504 RepID=UPI0004270E77|nr:methyltransferase [Algoriphagus mannitolivorans]